MWDTAILAENFGENTVAVSLLMNYVQLFIDCQDCMFIARNRGLCACRGEIVAGNSVGFLFPTPAARMHPTRIARANGPGRSRRAPAGATV
jgi:hypothetical protein